MTVNLFGISIHEFDVVITDFLLFIELFIFVYFLFRQRSSQILFRRLLIILFIFFGLSSLFGALFHAFFPLKMETQQGFLFWMLVANSIGISASIIWVINALLLGKKIFLKKSILFALIYVAIIIYHLVYISYQFKTIIIFYAFPIATLLLVSIIQFIRGCFRATPECWLAWIGLIIGVVLTFAAAAVQYLQISIHPAYFNYNALYHVIQGIAFAFMFFSFRVMLKR